MVLTLKRSLSPIYWMNIADTSLHCINRNDECVFQFIVKVEMLDDLEFHPNKLLVLASRPYCTNNFS